MSCEMIFAKRRFPDKASQIDAAYILKEKYDKKFKALSNLYANGDPKLYDAVKKCVSLYDNLVSIDNNFSAFLLTNKSHNLKREKALDKIDPLAVKRAALDLEQLDKFDLYFLSYKFSVQKLIKLVLDCRKISASIKSARRTLEIASDNPEKHFRELFKIE